MKRTIIIAAALVAMAGCNKELIETPIADSDYGYINLGVTADTDITVTKAGADGTNGVTSSTDLSGYNFTLYNGDGKVDGWPKEFSAISKTDLKVASGTYKIEVENYTITETYSTGSGKVRVKGVQENISVEGGKTKSVTVNCDPANSKITVQYTADFADMFDISTATVNLSNAATGSSNGDDYYPARTLSMNMTLASTEAEAQNGEKYNEAFFEPGQVSWALSITNKDSVSRNYSGTIDAEADHWKILKFNAGKDGQISVSVVVDETMGSEEPVDVTVNPLDNTVQGN